MDADLGLGRFPRVRLTDATPLHPLRRLSAALGGPEIWMKRDDLTGFAMGGNKARKLEFLAADAQARGADTRRPPGANEPNDEHRAAAAAAIHGMACRAVVQNVFSSTDRDYLTNGNALLFDLFGASIVTVPTDADLEAALAREVEAVRAAGGRPYAVPVGGASPIGALGYVAADLRGDVPAAVEEICGALRRGKAPDPGAFLERYRTQLAALTAERQPEIDALSRKLARQEQAITTFIERHGHDAGISEQVS